jgi:hypothetical protein
MSKRRLQSGFKLSPVSGAPVTMTGPKAYLKLEGDSIRLEVGKLPQPADNYTANLAWMERDETLISFMFGNRDRDEPERLKTRVELRFAAEAFVNTWQNSKEFFYRIKTAVQAQPFLEHAAPSQHPRTMKTDREHLAPASIVVMTHAGSQAELTFFDLPSTRIFLFQKSRDFNDLDVTPVLRVFTSTGLLVHLLSEAETIDKEMREFVPMSKDDQP